MATRRLSESSLLGLLGVGSSLDALSVVTGVGAGDSGFRVSISLLVLSGDSGELIGGLGDGAGKDMAGDLVGSGGGLDLLGGGVIDETLLGLALTSGEEDQLGFVRVESLSVELELLLGGGGASVVNGDAHSACEASAQTSGLELSEGEATAVSDLTGVPAGAGGDNGAELLDGAGEHFFCFPFSLLESDELLGGLVEVNSESLHSGSLPVLAEMYVWDDVVVLDHC